MSDNNFSMEKMSRRAAILGIVGTAGFMMGWSNNAVIAAASTTAPTIKPGTTLYTYKRHTSSVIAVAWSPDSQLVASLEQQGAVHVWEAATGKLHFMCKHPELNGTDLAWSANGKYIAGASLSGATVWDAHTGARISHIPQQGITALKFSPDSQRIATSSYDETVQIWHATTAAHILTYTGQKEAQGLPVASLSWSPDGKRIVSSTSQLGGSGPHGTPSVKIWDASTGKDILIHTTQQSNAVAWSPDGAFIASEEYRNTKETVQIWSTHNAQSHALPISQDSVTRISWSPTSKYVALAIGSYQALVTGSRVEIHSAHGNSYTLTYKGHGPNVRNVAWSPNGIRIASCSDDQTVQIWQAPM